MNKSEIEQQALSNATQNTALTNYPAIYAGFAEKGIPESEIKPRVNVFTYNAWKALGRQVRKGEHGVKVSTWIVASKSETTESGEQKQSTYRSARTTTVFHVSQTDLIAYPKAPPDYSTHHAEFTQSQALAEEQYKREHKDRTPEYYSNEFTPM